MRSAGVLFTSAALVFAASCLAAVKLVEDEPTAAVPKAGSVAGRVVPVERISQLSVISRATGKSYRADSFDKKTGRFTVKDLPGDAAYDVCITTTDGRGYQGIDLAFTDARMLRLAALRRKQLGLPPQREHRFRREDVKWLCEFVAGQESFTDIRRVLYVRGHGRRATLLVELMRTRRFHQAGGTIVWRIELWYFDYKFDGWQRLANQERVIERRRTTPAKWRKIHIEYYPQLSAYISPEGKCKPIEFKIPDKPDMTRGRPANTAPKLNTKPHVLGLDSKAGPATRPTS